MSDGNIRQWQQSVVLLGYLLPLQVYRIGKRLVENESTCDIWGSHSGVAEDSSIVGYDAVLLSIAWCFKGVYCLPLQGQAFKNELRFHFDCLGLNMKVLQSLETSETTCPMTVHHLRSCEYSRRVAYYLWKKRRHFFCLSLRIIIKNSSVLILY